MNRRLFLTLTAAAFPFASFAAETVEYTMGLIERELAAGKTLLVDYSATWCTTCKRQERVLGQLRGENPEYDKNITFIKVDWDTYKNQPVTTGRNIPRRSTLILLRGDEELGRIVAGTSHNDIKALLDLGL